MLGREDDVNVETEVGRCHLFRGYRVLALLTSCFLAPPSGCEDIFDPDRWSSTDRLNSGIPPGFGIVDFDPGAIRNFRVWHVGFWHRLRVRGICRA